MEKCPCCKEKIDYGAVRGFEVQKKLFRGMGLEASKLVDCPSCGCRLRLEDKRSSLWVAIIILTIASIVRGLFKHELVYMFTVLPLVFILGIVISPFFVTIEAVDKDQ